MNRRELIASVAAFTAMPAIKAPTLSAGSTGASVGTGVSICVTSPGNVSTFDDLEWTPVVAPIIDISSPG